MNGEFLKLLNMSISASWAVLAVLLLRFVLKKAPKWIVCLLWGVVALRLLVPVTVESPFSLIPSAEVFPADITVSQSPAIHSGIPAVNSRVNPMLTAHVLRQAQPLESIVSVAAAVWIVGVAAILFYGVVSYLLLRRRVRICAPLQDGVYLCDDIASAFILGFVRPRIYLPSGLESAHQRHVLAHEYAHIRRRDHWWKPLGFGLLCVYWMNPLLWLAYILLCRDIEQACDEKVIARLDTDGKMDYSQALLACSMHRRMILVCPVAFGEVSVKGRIKSVLHYKKPAFWMLVLSAAACVAVAVCFLTNPKLCFHQYDRSVAQASTCTQRGMETLTCGSCGYSRCAPLALAEHTYDPGTVTAEPTCLQSGLLEQHCTSCGAVRTQPLSATGHTPGEQTVTIAPNCSREGELTAVCTVCDASYVVQILPANQDHNLQEMVLREPTCTAEGVCIRTCSRCGYSQQASLEKLAHSYREGTRRPGSCKYPGSVEMVCDCGAAYSVNTGTDASAHTWLDMGYYLPDQCLLCGCTRVGSDNVPNYDLSSGLTGGLHSTPSTPQLPVVQWDLSGKVYP